MQRGDRLGEDYQVMTENYNPKDLLKININRGSVQEYQNIILPK